MATPDIFSDIFSASPIGIAVEDFEGQPLFVNPALCSMLGFSLEELRSKHCFDFSPPEDAEKDWALFQQLRAGSIDHYQMEKRYFRRDGSLMWGSLSLSLLISRPSPLVIAMVEDITKKKLAEEALTKMNRTLEAQDSLLRSREELLRVFVKNVPAAVAMLDRDMCYLQVSDRWCTDYLLGRVEVLGHSHYETFPDMPERWKEVHRRALQGETMRADEDRWDGQNGTHWARWEIRPWSTADGAVGGILILTEDITRRKQMEEALSDLSRKLIESQEQEGARIGRELHDNICQRVALLAIRLGQLKTSPSGLSDEIRNQLSKMEKETAELSMRIQQLSRELHSSTLEFLGLSEAIRNWCDEFSEKWSFEILFEDHDLPTSLPSEIALNLFRVFQEALNNAAKYSGVEHFDVRLWGTSAEIHLSVTDHGKGFDISSAMMGRGIGLKSMRERVKLVNGHLTIESKPNQGTKIHARVPVESGDQPSQGINSA